mgnify:CR=1 FL=1
MKLFENLRDALKIAKKIKELDRLNQLLDQESTTEKDYDDFLKETKLTDDIKNDILIIKEGVKRLGAKIPAIKDLFELIF